MKLFITGVTGYIGQRVMIRAIQKGYSVHALTRRTENEGFSHPNLNYCRGDINDYESVLSGMKECNSIIHCAGITQLWHRNPGAFYKVNVNGTENILKAALQLQVNRLVFTSSCGVLGPSKGQPISEDDPRISAYENDYEISKHCAEEMIRDYGKKGINAVIVRPSRVYGPGLATKGNPINQMLASMLKKGYAFIPSDTDVVGNYVFIEDVVEGHFLALEKGACGESYNIGGENLSYKVFFNIIKEVIQQKLILIPVAKSLLKTAAASAYTFCRLTGAHTHLTPKTIERLFQNREVSCAKAVNEIGYVITPFKEAIGKTINYIKNQQYESSLRTHYRSQ